MVTCAVPTARKSNRDHNSSKAATLLIRLPESMGQANRPQNSQLPRLKLHYDSSCRVIPRQTLTLVTVFFMLLKYPGCFVAFRPRLGWLPFCPAHALTTLSLHAPSSCLDADLLSKWPWVLADAPASCRALGSLSIPPGCGPQVSGWGWGLVRYGVCSQLLLGCPQVGWEMVSELKISAPGKLVGFAPSLVSPYKFRTLHPPGVPQLLCTTAIVLPLCK